MAQYIDKSALLTEIERIRVNAIQFPFEVYGTVGTCDKILSFLDTLEVKEVDFDNSLTCNVRWYDSLILDYTQEQQDVLSEKLGVNVGDKIKIVILKGE